MPYLNLDLAFPRHPKTKRLVGLLGRGAEMLLIRLWCHCGEYHCETGALTGLSEEEIEATVEWWGEKGKAVAAMLRVGFLVKEGDGYAIKDWLDHSGHLAAFKEWGKEAANKRWAKHREDAGNAARIATSNAPTNQLTNQPTRVPPKRASRGKNARTGDAVNIASATIKELGLGE